MFRTLIVEDNDTFRNVLKDLLCTEFSSVTFEEARDGSEALRKIEYLQPDIILMDVKLPGENGLEITKKVRLSYCKATIIILTNYDFPEYRDAALLYGANYFLSKGSTTSNEIVRLVDSVLKDVNQDNKAGM